MFWDCVTADRRVVALIGSAGRLDYCIIDRWNPCSCNDLFVGSEPVASGSFWGRIRPEVWAIVASSV